MAGTYGKRKNDLSNMSVDERIRRLSKAIKSMEADNFNPNILNDYRNQLNNLLREKESYRRVEVQNVK